ncbi:hypothetical protein DFJ63DRAFT_332484 [Scheffersomyces coipomensis]|uniref:uncharacterized protein n=1 Tax=Scheffersomyces coipomensis TaxID=1788519 RepID=UPI00315DA5B3
MSINNVTLKNGYMKELGTSRELPFELLVGGGEELKYSTQTGRQSLSINSHDNQDSIIHISAKDGFIYLTTKRLIFITASQGDINSFSIDLRFADKLQLSHELKSPWFGANFWEFIFFSSNVNGASDGFPTNKYFKGSLKFNDGGLFTFVEVFNTVLNDNVNNTHIDEELPRYTEY